MNSACINKFGALAGLVKKIKRTGWTRYLPKQVVESVGDHSAKIAFLTLFLRNIENVDYKKCMQMALIHDIAQGIVGDYTPYCNIRQITVEIVQIFSPLGEGNSQYFQGVWREYEEGQSYEAKIVKDLDKLQMIQQALVYEKEHKVNLQEFYSCIAKMRTQLVRGWAEQLYKERRNMQFLQCKQVINNGGE